MTNVGKNAHIAVKGCGLNHEGAYCYEVVCEPKTWRGRLKSIGAVRQNEVNNYTERDPNLGPFGLLCCGLRVVCSGFWIQSELWIMTYIFRVLGCVLCVVD